MKIYFVGAHSTGKTTCARYVSETYKVPMITEIARTILAEKELRLDSLRIDLNIVDDFQTKTFYRQIQEEDKYNDFVSDRSFDCLAYAAQHSRCLPDLLKSDELKTYLTKLKLLDSFIFFVRPSKATLKEDGVREYLTWDGIIAIDAQVKFLCEMFQLRYFQINTDNMKERVTLIDSVLSLR